MEETTPQSAAVAAATATRRNACAACLLLVSLISIVTPHISYPGLVVDKAHAVVHVSCYVVAVVLALVGVAMVVRASHARDDLFTRLIGCVAAVWLLCSIAVVYFALSMVERAAAHGWKEF